MELNISTDTVNENMTRASLTFSHHGKPPVSKLPNLSRDRNAVSLGSAVGRNVRAHTHSCYLLLIQLDWFKTSESTQEEKYLIAAAQFRSPLHPTHPSSPELCLYSFHC